MSERLETPEADQAFDDPWFPLEPPPPTLWQRVRGWLLFLVVVASFAAAFLALGNWLYAPESRIPRPPDYTAAEGLLGASRSTSRDIEAIREVLSKEDRIALELEGEVHQLDFPRTLLDRLLGKREESAVFFVATLASGQDLSFLVLLGERDGILFAVERPTIASRRDAFEGAYLALPAPAATGDALGQVSAELHALLPDLEAAARQRLSAEDFVIFGAFSFGAGLELLAALDTNIVLDHLASRLEEADAGVSLAAPAFLVRPAAESGEITALYQPARRLIQKPVWGEARLTSLAHELVHAFLDRVSRDALEGLQSAATYFETAHPRLHGEVVGDLYEWLDETGRAEETLAFLTGAVANRQTQTVATARLLASQGARSISEPVLVSDVQLLIELGILPVCMEPLALGFAGPEIVHSYYEAVDEACGPPEAARMRASDSWARIRFTTAAVSGSTSLELENDHDFSE